MLREAHGLFFNLSRSDEDLRRTEMYRAEATRKEAEAESGSLDDYLASLELRVSVEEGERVGVARAAQMTQKTNQFNLTTRRYTESDIARFIADPDSVVATFSVSDRFGDYGVTGLVIARIERASRQASLDTFLMSCRVLGRKVENAVMNWVADRLRREDLSQLSGEYLASAKNAQVADLLDRLGFQRLSADPRGARYQLALEAYADQATPSIEIAA